MTIAPPAPPSLELWTFERYMETPIEGRFEIIEGALKPMPSPVLPHQIIVIRLAGIFLNYQDQTQSGLAVVAPSDILIRRFPRLQTRQPDVYYISLQRLRQAGGVPERGPLEIGPELVVEIISDSETEESVEEKTVDYISVGVLEEWRVYRNERRVDVVDLTAAGAAVIAAYRAGETVVSRVFPDLAVAVDAIFAAPTL